MLYPVFCKDVFIIAHINAIRKITVKFRIKLCKRVFALDKYDLYVFIYMDMYVYMTLCKYICKKRIHTDKNQYYPPPAIFHKYYKSISTTIHFEEISAL
jgi:hypothetical protein